MGGAVVWCGVLCREIEAGVYIGKKQRWNGTLASQPASVLFPSSRIADSKNAGWLAGWLGSATVGVKGRGICTKSRKECECAALQIYVDTARLRLRLNLNSSSNTHLTLTKTSPTSRPCFKRRKGYADLWLTKCEI